MAYGIVLQLQLAEQKPNQQQTLAQTARLSLVIISDIHVQEQDAVAQRKFRDVLTDVARFVAPPDALIINGDLGNGKPADYLTLRSIIKDECSRPNSPRVLFNIGNHEFYRAYFKADSIWSPKDFPNGETEQAALKRYLAFNSTEKVYYDIFVNGYHLIFLGSERSAMSNRNYGDNAYLSKQQLSWLETKLQESANSNQPVFVFLHQPLRTPKLGQSNELAGMVLQQAELLAILRDYPEVIFFSGHLHRKLRAESTVLRGGIAMFDSSSVYDHAEGLVVQVYENRVVVTGRDFMSQSWIPTIQYILTANLTIGSTKKHYVLN